MMILFMWCQSEDTMLKFLDKEVITFNLETCYCLKLLWKHSKYHKMTPNVNHIPQHTVLSCQ